MFITDQFLNALRARISWGTRGMISADSRILKALEQPIAMQGIDDAPLKEVLTYIKMATSAPSYPGIPIYVDPIGLEEAEKSLTSKVSIDLEGLPLKTTLRLCLKQLGLAYKVEDGYLRITSQEDDNSIPESDDPFLIVGHSLLALLSALLGGVAALFVSGTHVDVSSPKPFCDGDRNVHVHVDRRGHGHAFPGCRRFRSVARDRGCFSRSASATSADACMSATRRSK